MIPEAQRENTKPVLKELFSLWDNRSGLYGKVVFGSAIAKAPDKKWRNVTSFLPGSMHSFSRKHSGV